ncbi:hypothetical protein BS78_02G214000 [Paspalum vaginatum]|nr:hypothetical protein BS78_02G214000 [Paspalum vaginatum]
MVHMNMHGNDWERRHRSAATFLESIMMREKIIWRVVGSVPPSPQWLHEASPPRSGTGECAPPRPAAAAVHETGQKERGNGSWLAKATRRHSPHLLLRLLGGDGRG